MREKLIRLAKGFTQEEDGIETIEFIGLVAVAAVMIGVIISIATNMKETATTAQSSMQGALNDISSFN